MTAKPDITVVDRSIDDKYIIAACDGIWDVLSNQQESAFTCSASYLQNFARLDNRQRIGVLVSASLKAPFPD